MSDLRRAAAVVAHVLHTPITVLEEADIADLLEWADDGAELLGRLYPRRKG